MTTLQRVSIALLAVACLAGCVERDPQRRSTECRQSGYRPLDEQNRRILTGVDPTPRSQRIVLDDQKIDGLHINNTDLSYLVANRASFRNVSFKANSDLQNSSLTHICAVYMVAPGANLLAAQLKNAILNFAQLNNASFIQASLRSAYLYKTDLRGADLSATDLVAASLLDTDLEGAILGDGTDLSDALWNPVNVAGIARIGSLVGTHRLRVAPEAGYDVSSLIALRLKLAALGRHDDARNVLSSQRRMETRRDLAGFSNNPLSGTGALARLLFLELTIDYGRTPDRGLMLIALTWLLFTIGYFIMFRSGNSTSRHQVYIVLPKGQSLSRTRRPPNIPIFAADDQIIPLDYSSIDRILRTAASLSLEATFRIGYGNLDVGGLLARLRRREMRYYTEGSMRTLVGLQSLIGTYLIVITLWAWLSKYV